MGPERLAVAKHNDRILAGSQHSGDMAESVLFRTANVEMQRQPALPRGR